LELLCRSDGKATFGPVIGKLGEIVKDISVLKACLRAMEEDAVVTEAGYLRPASNDAYRLFGIEASDRFVRIMQDIAASTLIPTSSEKDFLIPGAGPLIERFFKGLAPTTTKQMRLMALAGDMTQSSFGARTQLYERFNMGPPDMIEQRLYRNTNTGPWVERVERFIDNL
jgi:4-hydroxyphenylacetate 3-monooxygenase